MPNRFSERALRESQAFGVRQAPILRPWAGWRMAGTTSGKRRWLRWRRAWSWPCLARCCSPWRMTVSGCCQAPSPALLLAPVMATGLYALSRDIDRNLPVGLHGLAGLAPA